MAVNTPSGFFCPENQEKGKWKMQINAEDIIGWRDGQGNVYCNEHGDVENMEPIIKKEGAER